MENRRRQESLPGKFAHWEKPTQKRNSENSNWNEGQETAVKDRSKVNVEARHKKPKTT